MISATASQEGPHRPPPASQPRPPPPSPHHGLSPHHPLLGPPSTMAQLPPLPLPLPLPHPLYPHHQLAPPPPHPYLHPHHHHHHHSQYAAAAAMIAFEQHRHSGHHPLAQHHLGTPISGASGPPHPPPPGSAGAGRRSPSPPRFLRPHPPSRPVPNHAVPAYNGVRSPEAAEATGPGGGEERLKEGSEAVDVSPASEEDGGEAVNLVHKRSGHQEDLSGTKRSRMVINGSLGGRAGALGGFAPHTIYQPTGPIYFSQDTTPPSAPLLAPAPYSPSATSSAPAPASSPYSLHTSPQKHPAHHVGYHDQLPPPSSAPIAPTFTSPALTVGPITTPVTSTFPSYDPFYPTSPVKPGQSVLRRPSLPPPATVAPRLSAAHFPPPLPPAAPAPALSPPQATAFKVPSGKEGSLKHRLLLTRSEAAQNGGAEPPRSPSASKGSPPSSGVKRRKGSGSKVPSSAGLNPSTSSSSSSSTPSPPGAPRGQQLAGQALKSPPGAQASPQQQQLQALKSPTAYVGTPPPPSTAPSGGSGVSTRNPLEECFSKGSLIQLRGGKVVRVEELRTEDFVRSAEGSEAIRLDPSTVVALEERPEDGTARLTLAYGSDKQRSQVELESTLEQPFFVVGRGWASVCPERSLRRFGLSCLPLKIGHVCISLTERPNAKGANSTAVKEELPKPGPFEIKASEANNGESKTSQLPTSFPSSASSNSSRLRTNQETLNPSSRDSKALGSPESKAPSNAEGGDKASQRDLSPASRKRRWSAPGPLSNEEEEKPKNPGSIQPRHNRTSLGVTSVKSTSDS